MLDMKFLQIRSGIPVFYFCLSSNFVNKCLKVNDYQKCFKFEMLLFKYIEVFRGKKSLCYSKIVPPTTKELL